MTETGFTECIDLLRQGNMQGLAPIYREYGKLVYSAALSVCGSPDTAEDILSEFFLRFKKAADVYRSGVGHKKWLMISARNLAVDYIRKNRRDIPSSEDKKFTEEAENSDTEERVTGQVNVEQMLAALTEAERETVNLKVYCGFTLSEIADIMHVPIGTAAWRYSSGIKKLKKLYGEAQV